MHDISTMISAVIVQTFLSLLPRIHWAAWAQVGTRSGSTLSSTWSSRMEVRDGISTAFPMQTSKGCQHVWWSDWREIRKMLQARFCWGMEFRPIGIAWMGCPLLRGCEDKLLWKIATAESTSTEEGLFQTDAQLHLRMLGRDRPRRSKSPSRSRPVWRRGSFKPTFSCMYACLYQLSGFRVQGIGRTVLEPGLSRLAKIGLLWMWFFWEPAPRPFCWPVIPKIGHGWDPYHQLQHQIVQTCPDQLGRNGQLCLPHIVSFVLSTYCACGLPPVQLFNG